MQKGQGRGGIFSARRSSSQPNVSKAPKRDFDMVSPASPKGNFSLSAFKSLLKESLAPLTADLDSLKSSAKFTTDTLAEIGALTNRVKKLESESSHLKTRLGETEKRCGVLEEKITAMESYSRRNNLKFLNIAREGGVEDCESTIIDLCEKYGIPIQSYQIERAHRLGSQSPKLTNPILVRFLSFKDRQRVFQEKGKFKQDGIVVVEDFPREILQKRKMFSPVLRAVYNSSSHKARLQGDKLLLDGKLHSVDDLDKLPDHLKPHNLTTVTKANITAFFSFHSKFSNHYPCHFEVDRRHYSSVEQCFMHKKATLFNDQQTANKIMNTNSPVDAKNLGKKVQNFRLDV